VDFVVVVVVLSVAIAAPLAVMGAAMAALKAVQAIGLLELVVGREEGVGSGMLHFMSFLCHFFATDCG
jgi:hypothetical protein